MGIIEIKDFGFSYGDSEKKALNSVSLDVEEGEFLVLCGKSGCGKSTLLRNLKKSIAPFGKKQGSILINGRNADEISPKEESTLIGYVMQNPENQIVTDKVWHELAFGLESIGMPNSDIRLRVAEMATYFGINDRYHKKVCELSGGQKQIMNLAGVMAMSPRILILDEPTSQLDPIAAADFIETVKKINRDFGTTVIITEHRLEDVMTVADRAALMEDGKITFTGAAEELAGVLYNNKNEMFVSMPSSAKIALELGEKKKLPLTVNEGIKWVRTNVDTESIKQKKQVDNAEKSKNLNKRENIILSIKELCYCYDKNSPYIINGLSLNIERGEIFSLLGGNGSGKSTLLALLAGIRIPCSGKILIDSKNLYKIDSRSLYNGIIGALPQNPQHLFARKTVIAELEEMLRGHNTGKSEETGRTSQARLEEIIRLTMLEGVSEQHPYDLSGGEQQRLALAKILLLKPQILLLDEPTKGMDGYYKQQFGRMLTELKNKGVTVFIVSHDIEFCAEYADRCGLLFDGKIISCGTAKQFFCGNTFYTTAANKIMRGVAEGFTTTKEVIECLKK